MTEPIWVSRAEAERLHELVIEVAGGIACPVPRVLLTTHRQRGVCPIPDSAPVKRSTVNVRLECKLHYYKSERSFLFIDVENNTVYESLTLAL